MKSLTHIASANAVALTVIRPNTLTGVLTTCVFATLGGALPDVDTLASRKIKKLENNYIYLYGVKYLDVLIFLVCCFMLCLIGYDAFMNENIMHFFISVPAIIAFYMYLFKARRTSHRTMTHSLMSLVVLSSLAFISVGYMAIPFFIGYLLHLILDVFTIRELGLLYPLKKGYSLKLAVYNGKANKVICIISLIIVFIYLICFLYI